jgi:hypothetical protein
MPHAELGFQRGDLRVQDGQGEHRMLRGTVEIQPGPTSNGVPRTQCHDELERSWSRTLSRSKIGFRAVTWDFRGSGGVLVLVD